MTPALPVFYCLVCATSLVESRYLSRTKIFQGNLLIATELIWECLLGTH